MDKMEDSITLIKDNDMSISDDYIPNNGSSPLEIFVLMSLAPGLSTLISMIYYLHMAFDYMSVAHSFFLNVVLLALYTIWSKYLYTVFLCMVLSFVFLTLFGWTKHKTLAKKNDYKVLTWSSVKSIKIGQQGSNVPFLEDLRGHLLHTTAICILAVDFDIFPVRFAKTDTYGWSIMDAGVGMFVGLHGIFSSQARSKPTNSLRKSVLSSLPLLALGFVRLILVTAVQYHIVISEYGVHWNFFFTLAFLKLICSFMAVFISWNNLTLPVIVLVIHQLLLSNGMSDYILLKERYNLLDQNKEGVCSLLGFVAIYFGSLEIGKLLWKPRSQIIEYFKLFLHLQILWITGSFVAGMLHYKIQPVSRRFANLPYCVWSLALLCLLVSIHIFQHLVEAVYKKMMEYRKETVSDPIVMKSHILWTTTNYSGLSYFLLANVLTGIVNLSINTSNVSPLSSLVILIAYTTLLMTASFFMHRYSIRVKLW